MVATALYRVTTGFVWSGFWLVRLGERVLPQGLLAPLLWAPALVWAATDFRKLPKILAAHDRFPEAWRPPLAVFFFRQSIGSSHARFVYLWPDRLRDRRWLRRCHVKGIATLAQLRRGDRRAVLASLHFGPFETLPYWLRAHGVAVTVLVGRPAPRQRLKQRQYALSAPAEVPVVLPVGATGSIRQVISSAAGHLIVMVDVDRGKQIEVPFDQHLFRMATGAIRLAAMTGAELIPCLIVETRRWQFAIYLGKPVPAPLLGGSPDVKGAALHLLAEFLPVINDHPSQCGARLLSCITRAGRAST